MDWKEKFDKKFDVYKPVYNGYRTRLPSNLHLMPIDTIKQFIQEILDQQREDIELEKKNYGMKVREKAYWLWREDYSEGYRIKDMELPGYETKCPVCGDDFNDIYCLSNCENVCDNCCKDTPNCSDCEYYNLESEG